MKIENLFLQECKYPFSTQTAELLSSIDSLESTSALLDKTSGFADFRRSLIRSNRIADLGVVLDRLVSHSLLKDESKVSALWTALLFNKYWHNGELDECQAYLSKGKIDNDPFTSLSKVFNAYYLNTTGNFEASLETLNSIDLADPNRETIEHFLGVDLECVRATWRIWNRTETLNYEGIEEDLSYVEKVKAGVYKIPPKSASLLFLGIGVFYLAHNNYDRSANYLSLAKNQATEDGSIWLPRIYSALSLCEQKRGNASLSAQFLQSSISGLSTHFGPSGWMIRIAQTLSLHDRQKEADELLCRIVQETERKGEKGYEVWSKIHLMEGDNLLLPPQNLFELARKCGMNRACQYMLEKNLL